MALSEAKPIIFFRGFFFVFKESLKAANKCSASHFLASTVTSSNNLSTILPESSTYLTTMHNSLLTEISVLSSISTLKYVSLSIFVKSTVIFFQ
jgi:hypothetical protein